jgi:spermidine/putrescine transport system substrate-binding protein
MKKWFVLALCMIPLLGWTDEKKVLHIYNWADYMKAELIQSFEEQFNCRVMQDYFDSNEAMYAKLKAGATGYDLIFPSSYMVNVMKDQGMLMALDHDKIPNLRFIDPAYLKFTMDPGMEYGVPYMVGSTGIGYDGSRVEDFVPSWSMFDNEAYAGRMTLLNDMREAIGAALKFLGYSINSTDEAQLAEARDVVIRWKRNIAKFESEQYKNGLVSAEFLLVQGYSGDILQAMDENEDVVYAIPREGTSLASDDMVIPVDAREPDLAHAFINFLHEPQNAADNTGYVYYLCPNKASYELLDEEIRNDPSIFLDPAVVEKCEVILDLGEDNAKYIKVWDEVRAAE